MEFLCIKIIAIIFSLAFLASIPLFFWHYSRFWIKLFAIFILNRYIYISFETTKKRIKISELIIKKWKNKSLYIPTNLFNDMLHDFILLRKNHLQHNTKKSWHVSLERFCNYIYKTISHFPVKKERVFCYWIVKPVGISYYIHNYL